MKKTMTILSLSLMAGQTLQAQWNADPAVNNLICTGAQDQQDVRIVTDGAGGAIMTWVDFRNDASQTAGDIYVQRVSASGQNMWTANGVAVCTQSADQTAPIMVADGAGGAIIVWQDWRSGDRDIYAQRISANGIVMWANNGVPVVVKAGNQSGPRLVSDGAQGAVIIWEDDQAGTPDILAQWLVDNGSPQWNMNGATVCNAADNQINPRIDTDGAGAYYVTWQDRRNGVDYDIYAQKLNSSGAVQWAANGVAISTATNTQTNPKIRVDQAGYPIIAWQHTSNNNGYDVHAQRVSPAGVVQWAANGVAICNAAGNQSAIDMTTENLPDGAILTWKDGRTTKVHVYCQKVSATGAAAWTANGVLVSDASRNQINPNIVGDGAGGGIIAWQDSVSGVWDIYAQRISAAGSTMWTAGGVAVGIATDNQTSVKNVSDGQGGSIFSFQDKRSGDFDIYAYKLDNNGVVAGLGDENSAHAGFSVFPNPSTSVVHLTFNLMTPGPVQGEVLDMTGRQIRTFDLGTLAAGDHSYMLPVETLRSGSYAIRLAGADGMQRRAMIMKE